MILFRAIVALSVKQTSLWKDLELSRALGASTILSSMSEPSTKKRRVGDRYQDLGLKKQGHMGMVKVVIEAALNPWLLGDLGNLIMEWHCFDCHINNGLCRKCCEICQKIDHEEEKLWCSTHKRGWLIYESMHEKWLRDELREDRPGPDCHYFEYSGEHWVGIDLIKFDLD